MSSLTLPPVIAGAAAGACALAVAAYATFTPRAAIWSPVIWHGDRSSPARAALTFDDGPSPESTPAILDALGELNVRAAFFVIGANAARQPALLRRIVEEGHIIGNHSYDHHHSGILHRGRYWREQVVRTDEVIEANTGRRPGLFRPPMGFRTPHVTRAARRRGQRVVTWTRRALDGVSTTQESILHRLAGTTGAGDIVMMHDGVEPSQSYSREATLRALRPLVNAWRDRGIGTARLDELIGEAPYVPAPSSHLTADSPADDPPYTDQQP